MAAETPTMKSLWYKPIIWGGALFSMFFGAGNMIYSLWMGYLVDNTNYWWGATGFMGAAVILPLLGLLGIVSQHGCAMTFLAPLKSKKFKLIALSLLLLVWAPFGSVPRAVILTFASIEMYTPFIPFWLGNLVIIAWIGWMVTTPQGLVKHLGTWLTFLLVAVVVALFYMALQQPVDQSLSRFGLNEMFFEGGLLGYQTMDGISAIFFGKLLVEMFNSEKLPKKVYRRFFAYTFLVAMVLMTVVYMMLLEAAARFTDQLNITTPASLIAQLSSEALGFWGGILTSALMVMACVSTAVALVLIISEFVHTNLLPKLKRQQVTWGVCAVSYLVSLTGIAGIRAISQPLLTLFYPLILLLSLYLIIRKVVDKSEEADEPHILEEG